MLNAYDLNPWLKISIQGLIVQPTGRFSKSPVYQNPVQSLLSCWCNGFLAHYELFGAVSDLGDPFWYAVKSGYLLGLRVRIFGIQGRMLRGWGSWGLFCHLTLYPVCNSRLLVCGMVGKNANEISINATFSIFLNRGVQISTNPYLKIFNFWPQFLWPDCFIHVTISLANSNSARLA